MTPVRHIHPLPGACETGRRNAPLPSRDCPPVTGSTHDVAAATRWFAQWHCYRTIVDHDWMSHAAIAAAIRDQLGHRRRSFAVLDLGCGDADPAIRALRGTAVASYTGVDAAAAALAEARRRLADEPYASTLVTADAVDDVATRAAREERFDVVMASYLVHHFPPEVKQRFFADCRRVLATDGEFFFADVHRLPGTTRDEYLAAYVDGMRSWQPITPEAYAATCDHLLAYDFPETEAFILEAAAAAGFDTSSSQLFVDTTGFHRLLRFTAAPRTP
jgi:SAM-dependent methyltransferase